MGALGQAGLSIHPESPVPGSVCSRAATNQIKQFGVGGSDQGPKKLALEPASQRSFLTAPHLGHMVGWESRPKDPPHLQGG